MRAAVLVVLVGVFVCASFCAPTAPVISEVFSSSDDITIEDERGNARGKGYWVANQPAGTAVEFFSFDDNRYDYFRLQRFDLGEAYQVNSINETNCVSYKLSGKMPTIWGWTADAHYIGQVGHGSDAADIWEAEVGTHSRLRVGVKVDDSTTPLYVVREANESTVTYIFTNWNTTADANYFTVPSACKSTTSTSTTTSARIV